MCCKGIAAVSCPTAKSPWCVCSCQGACHGGGGFAKPVPASIKAICEALRILHTYFPILKASRRYRSTRSGRPSRNASLRRLLRRGGIAFGGGSWSYQKKDEPELDHIAQEVVAILNYMEMENPGVRVPKLSDKLMAEIEEILAS